MSPNTVAPQITTSLPPSLSGAAAKPSPQAAIARFLKLRLDAQALMLEAAKLPGLPSLYHAQCKAAAQLCGMKLHRIVGASADDADLLALNDDAVCIATAVDPLIEAIGTEAKENSLHGIDISLFQGQLLAALDGNALFDLTQAADCAREDRDNPDNAAIARREFRLGKNI